MNSNEFLKNIKSNKSTLIWGVIFTVVSVIFFLIGYFSINGEEAIYLDTVDKVDDYAKVNVTLLDKYFATETYDSLEKRFHIILDDKNNLFVVAVNADTFNILEEIYNYTLSEEELETVPDTKTIFGKAKVIPDELYEFLIDMWEDEDGNKYNKAEIKQMVGSFYLDTYEQPIDDLVFIGIFSGIFTITGLIMIYLYIKRRNKAKKLLDKYSKELDDVARDINDGSGIHSKICKVYLTNSYLISYQNGLNIIKNSDIIWAYQFEYRTRGIVTQRSIYVITNNGKSHSIAGVSAWGRHNKKAYEEFYQDLMIKVPNALYGYSKENQEKVKDMINKK